MTVISKLQKLVEILVSDTARIDERDDAAIDLANFDDTYALNALILVASSTKEPEMLLASCGESIGEIWKRRGIRDNDILEKITPTAKREIKALLGK
jgi:hypothetical protein